MLGEDGLTMAIIMFTNKNDEGRKKAWCPNLFIDIQMYLHLTYCNQKGWEAIDVLSFNVIENLSQI